MKKEISPEGLKVQGPYSPAVLTGEWIYISGQLGIQDKETDIRMQTKKALENIRLILEKEGLTMDNVVKVTLFVKDGEDFEAVNEVYRGFFKKVYPARSTVFVSRLPGNALIEIEAIARR